MLIDLHLHESTHSSDSKMTLKEIVEEAKKRGLGGICITDHDSMGLREFAQQYSKEIGFPIFVGIEYYSLDGDITAFGIEEYPKERIPAQDFIDLVHSQGGVCIACHPYRSNNRGLKTLLREVKGLDGIEVLNGSTTMEANRQALEDCRATQTQPIGASDAHWVSQVGKYVTWLPEEPETLEDLVRIIKSGGCKPAIFEKDGYRVVDEF